MKCKCSVNAERSTPNIQHRMLYNAAQRLVMEATVKTPHSGVATGLKLARCPHSLIAFLTTLPSMSLIPFAPFCC
jgi:hypothetical protein